MKFSFGNQAAIDAAKWQTTLGKPATLAKLPASTTTQHEYKVTMRQVTHDFHPKLQNIPVWTYGPADLGAIIEADVSVPARIEWANELTDKKLEDLLVFGVRQGMEEDHMLKKPHSQVHMHGARVPGSSDGNPMEIFHPHEAHVFYYPNNQAAGTLWFHDHTMDVTRLNVYAGLFGMYLLRSPEEKTNLPSGVLEMPLILQDKSFATDKNGVMKLYYEQEIAWDKKANPPAFAATPEFIGDYPCVNGALWPIFATEPRIYRLRLLNGANTRFFKLCFKTDPAKAAKHKFHVLGMEGGFLKKPAEFEEITLAPGERADILLDLRTISGPNLYLCNHANIPYPGGSGDPLGAFAELVRIDISGVPNPADNKFDPNDPAFHMPPRIDPLIPPAFPADADFPAIDNLVRAESVKEPTAKLRYKIKFKGQKIQVRRFKLEEYQILMTTHKNDVANQPGVGDVSIADVTSPTVLMNGKSWKGSKPIKIAKNALEVWEFLNVTADAHPMHIHLVNFRIIGRNGLKTHTSPIPLPKLDSPTIIDDYDTKKVVHHYESGWKDTVRCNPGESTRLLMRFDGWTGNYVFHCHILEHEDMGMMLPIVVE